MRLCFLGFQRVAANVVTSRHICRNQSHILGRHALFGSFQLQQCRNKASIATPITAEKCM
jgi:hypothetical protein